MGTKEHLIWVIGLVLMVIIVCGTIIYLNSNPYSLKIEMDNNTLEAVKSIDWEVIETSKCNYPLNCPQSINNSDELNCEYPIKCGGYSSKI